LLKKSQIIFNTDVTLLSVQSVPAYGRQVYQKPAAHKPGLNFSLATLAQNEIQFGLRYKKVAVIKGGHFFLFGHYKIFSH